MYCNCIRTYTHTRRGTYMYRSSDLYSVWQSIGGGFGTCSDEEATCANPQICTVCGDVLVIIDHSYNDRNIYTVCGDTGTDGLKYTLITVDGVQSYAVSGIGTATDTVYTFHLHTTTCLLLLLHCMHSTVSPA